MNREAMEESIKKLRDGGVRITPQREAVLRYLIQSDEHPTADEIYRHLAADFPKMSVATVYNNLRVLTRLGIVQEMSYGDSSSRFDFAETKHYHAVCERCGRIVDVFFPDFDQVDTVAENLTGFQVNGHRLEVYGLCPQCQAELVAVKKYQN
ncbi:Fur family transcriptional regulator [Agrilactobacillus fermenti]|uniref:Fur family transcriptional regulator n=1 Tax=Agrilactobacillus fermenti TaxID=2586909 RepID=UPI001E5714A7|nr:Fur family transcriptional regulator [Agrilactobacillus fermenti]MCD2257247.1 transcriptional repressor [Agrilactobacillus fermenti]